MKLFRTVLMIAMLAVVGSSQVKNTENTVKLADGAKSPSASIKDIAWLAGNWSGTGMGGVSDETWGTPNNGVMVGTYRLVINNKPIFYEMMWMMEHEGSLILRLKHFSSELVGWEEKDKTVDFRFVNKTGNRMNFSGLTYEQTSKNKLTIYLALRQKDGTLKEESFVLTRSK
ncbi:MAG: hypothetical protein KA956_06365 [Pyrinomonadaceae bacterium]|nr:hypothetical protein [Acidobacteriota bacterium]MBK7932591.1 hypothetical protein [Acidobacteriota bacterium]MBP7376082.1 hypothetical protein [Pyrinomonadaceae bacterium]